MFRWIKRLFTKEPIILTASDVIKTWNLRQIPMKNTMSVFARRFEEVLIAVSVSFIHTEPFYSEIKSKRRNIKLKNYRGNK